MTGNTMLYFSLDGSTRRAVYPASNFLGVDLASASSMQVSFKKEDGALNAAIVALTFTGVTLRTHAKRWHRQWQVN
jgi:hypothetical protein